MLREQSVGSIMTLTKKIADANYVLEPVANAPLAVLAAACHSPTLEPMNIAESTDSDIYYRLIEATKQPDLSGKVPHDVAMDDIVKVVAKTVQANLHFAKNVVNPVIKECVDHIEKTVKDADIKAVNLLNVLPDTYRAIWDSPILDGMVQRYSETGIQDLSVMRVFPTLDQQTLMDHLSTGASRFDEEVKAWAADLPQGFIVDAYNAFFNKGNNSLLPENETFNAHFGMFANRDSILAIHLLARRFEKDIPEGVEVNLSDYKRYIIDVIAQSGRAICREMEKRIKDKKAKVLVKQWPAVMPEALGGVDSNIFVNADIYNEWLEAGGCPEILFGSFLVDRNTDYTNLIENAEKYKQAWNRQANLLKTRAASQRYNVTVSGIRSGITKVINATADEQLPIANRGALHERLSECVDKITSRDLEDLYATVRRIVCHVLYAHTNACDILCAIDEAGRANPGMDVREAALLATIDVVVAWVAKLFKVTPVTNNL